MYEFEIRTGVLHINPLQLPYRALHPVYKCKFPPAKQTIHTDTQIKKNFL